MDCIPCKGGYYCKDKGIGNVMKNQNKYKCPKGYYCPRGIGLEPYPCPSGTYLDEAEAASSALNSFDTAFVGGANLATDVKDCKICPRGFYCPPGTGDRYSFPCPGGHRCPMGAGAPLKCEPGFFCEGGLGVEKEICPEGYYCPIGTEVPKRCGPDDICDAGSSSPAQKGLTRYDCKPGEYLNVDRCYPCEPGHVCDEFTSQKYPIDFVTEGGYECPPGYYCPGATTTETI